MSMTALTLATATSSKHMLNILKPILNIELFNRGKHLNNGTWTVGLRQYRGFIH